jgi:hypothetical protein
MSASFANSSGDIPSRRCAANASLVTLVCWIPPSTWLAFTWLASTPAASVSPATFPVLQLLVSIPLSVAEPPGSLILSELTDAPELMLVLNRL